MAEQYQFRGALASLGLEALALDGQAEGATSTIWLQESGLAVHINLRGDPGQSAFSDACAKALGCDLPLEPNSVATGTDCTVLWLGPDEWLVLATVERGNELSDQWPKVAATGHVSVTDVSHARATIVLGGQHARDVLEKGCSLDLHPRAFGPGRCAQSTLALSQIILLQRDEAPTYEILVGRSFAVYLWKWLWDAAREHGPSVRSDAPRSA